MQRNICILGGAGFVGSHIVHQLDASGHRVKVLTRRRETAKHLILLPNVQVVECDIGDDVALRDALAGADVVINLVGILHETATAKFAALHAELPQRIVAACQDGGIFRLLHVSALQADVQAPSAYLRSKAQGEEAVRQSGLDWTVFRPSVIFGAGDSFLSLFAMLARWMPVLFLACPNARFQPIWVEDLARAVVRSLELPSTIQQSYDLCGPKVYTLHELVSLAAMHIGAKPLIIGLNSPLSWLQAWAMELLPIKLMTRDNVRSMQVDSVCNGKCSDILNIAPASLETVAPDYLAGNTPRARYLDFRTRAGRQT